MKIAILFLTIISLTFVSTNLLESLSSESMCREITVKVYSSIQPISQTFTLDVKKIRLINISDRESEFTSKNFVPLEEVGFVLEKTETSKTLNPIQHRYLRNEPTSAWMPYSYSGDWSRNGYVISNQMKRTSTSKTETPLVSFEFVNDKDLMSVSEEDMISILNWLKMNSEKRKTIKTQIKGKINVYQNAYFETMNTIANMKKTNNDNKAEIAKLKIRINVLITEITNIEKEEDKLDIEEAQKSAIMNTNNDDIDIIISKLTVLKLQLTKEEASLNDLKPTDTTLLQQELKSALLNIKLPQFPPQKFLEEYSIGKGNNAGTVKNAYENCVPEMSKFEKCKFALLFTGSLKKKLRRSFF